jgi:hypothetical protein
MCFLCGMNWGFISQKATFFIVTAVKNAILHNINRLDSVKET